MASQLQLNCARSTSSYLFNAVAAAGGDVRSAPQGALAYEWSGEPKAFILVQSGQLNVRFKTGHRALNWAECRAADGQDCMPVTAAILSKQAISVRAICASPTNWIELSPQALILLVHSQPTFRHALFAGHARRLPTFFSRITTKNAIGFDQRLAAWLIAHCEADGIRATHAQIADELLTAREVVSRRLKVFAEKGWIEQQRGRIMIDAPAALSRVAKDAFSLKTVSRCNALQSSPA